MSDRRLCTFDDNQVFVCIDTESESTTPLAVVANNSDEVCVYNMDTQCCELLGGHDDLVLGVCVSHDGRFLATCSKDSSVRLYFCGHLSAQQGDDEAEEAEEEGAAQAANVGGASGLSFRFALVSYLCVLSRSCCIH